MDVASHGMVGGVAIFHAKEPPDPRANRSEVRNRMSEKQGLMSSGFGMVARNKRYLVWFWLLNLTLAELGTSAFRTATHALLDHSFAAARLVRGFDLATLLELFARPEFGPMQAKSTPAFDFAFLFFLATALFLPGVFLGYASESRLPRDDFFRACGRNLWRFIRLLIVSGIILSIFAGTLFALQVALAKKADQSTSELLPFRVNLISLGVIFLIMTAVRIWFDLAEVDTVLNDQRAVRKSIWAGLKHMLRSLPRLLLSYVITTLVAAIVLVAGLWIWLKSVPPASVLGAFLVGQILLFLLLIPRFWQRGVAVSYWQQEMAPPAVVVAPPIPVEPVYPETVVAEVPEPESVVPEILPRPAES